MTHLSDIMDVSLLRRMVDEGFVKVQKHPDDERYQILNYTEKTVFAREWNAVTRNCRGLIIFKESPAQHALVIARPFAKFFNYGEQEADKIDLGEMVSVFDKVDGSCAIYFIAPDGKPAIATRGSFASDQAKHATELLRKRYSTYRAPEGFTPVFEVVYPANRIVLDYKGLDDLVLLGFVRISDGAVFHPTPFLDGHIFRCAEYFGTMPLHNAMKMMHRENAEGFVVRASETGAMVKLKEESYLSLHKIIFGLTERAVWERMAAGDSVERICDGLPDEFHEWVKSVAKRLDIAFTDIWFTARDLAYELSIGIDDLHSREGKKEYAERVKASGFAHPGLLFSVRDGKDINQAVWDLVKPEHRPYSSSIAA